ncbi:MAG: hypothetical protein HRU70_12450 [Phycisphaeraceae bacterium]|nr:MAG: hypothetical protein HRU70_12450 [Phycisphaeraceae bacterium]
MRKIFLSLSILAALAAFSLLSRCIVKWVYLAPYREEIRGAFRRFEETRGEFRPDDPDFLSLGIHPEWSRDQALDHLRSMGFDYPPRHGPLVNIDLLENYYRTVRDPEGGDTPSFGRLSSREVFAPYEFLFVYYGHDQRPLVISYNYRDFSGIFPIDVTRSYNLITREITHEFFGGSSYLGEVGVQRKDEQGVWRHVDPPRPPSTATQTTPSPGSSDAPDW